MKYAEYVEATSPSRTGSMTRICRISKEYGFPEGVRKWGTAGEVDRTSNNKRLIPRKLCLLTSCVNCPVAELYESEQE